MAYYQAADLRAQAGLVTEGAAKLELSRATKAVSGIYDIFLSHSVQDAVLVLGLKRLLERQDLTVYVDWIDDKDLERSNVSAATASRLRDRMRSCESLVYATSRNASVSRWMPWELGYFDGLHRADLVAICPIATGATSSYVGEEYLGLYKTLEPVRSGGVSRPFAVKPSGREGQPVRSFARGRGEFVGLSYS